MKTYTDVFYGTDSEQRLDIYLPEGECKGCFLYFHGGGIVSGDKVFLAVGKFAECMNKKGYALASANYRMYKSEGHPEFNAKYPDFIEDAAAAVAFLKNNAEKYRLGEKLIVGGSSAGGYLSMMLCYDAKYLGAHGIDPTDIDLYVHDAGQPTTHFNICTERGLPRYRCIVDEAAPLYHVGLAKEYSYQLIFIADNDIKARYEQTMLLMATLSSLGYDMSKVELKYMEGYTHTGYTEKLDENENSIFCTMICEYMDKIGL